MIKFRAKEFSDHIISDTLNGAKLGLTAGALTSAVLGRINKKGPVSFRHPLSNISYNSENDKDLGRKSLVISAGGLVIGAALGALAGTIKSVGRKINRTRTVDDRLMKNILASLKKSGMRENIDFTRDPKVANSLKIKVCIVITKYSDDLRLLINTVNDPKLKAITDKIVSNVPNGSVKNNTASDKFNEIVLTTISSAADPELVTEVVKHFIQSKYPVYLVEVG